MPQQIIAVKWELSIDLYMIYIHLFLALQEIYHKIESLNFNDCHTKIRQVDALSTLSNGVVVQVTGELSNAGQPLRRFMQTFVLGPQVN